MLIRRQTDIPFEQDPASRLLPWIVAIMIYLCGVAMAGAIVVNGLVAAWSSGLGGGLTVQLPVRAPAGAASGTDSGAGAARQQVDAVLAAVRKTPGVRQARQLSRQEVFRLVRPWLGDDPGAGDLPLPVLIDIRTAGGAAIDTAALSARIAAVAPGAIVETHARWTGRLVGLAHSIWLVSLLVVALIGLATAVTVVFATRTGLRIHRRVIGLLHLVGAHDRYIARQFERQALWLSLQGATVGIALAVGTVFAVAALASAGSGIDTGIEAGGIAPGLAGGVPFTPLQWGLFACVPVVAALVALLTARVTVLRTLRRMS